MNRSIEVCLSPALYPFRHTIGPHCTLVVDILRFTTALVAAFDQGAAEVLPAATLEEASQLKQKGFAVAAERDGKRLPFADYGNSPAGFSQASIAGTTLVYSTTNGTVAMHTASPDGPVAAACFNNFSAVCQWALQQRTAVVILCSGWKNLLSAEDTVCAGAIAAELLKSGLFYPQGDEAMTAVQLWKTAKDQLEQFITETSHYQRLLKLGINPLPTFTAAIDSSASVPVFDGKSIKNQRLTQ